MYKPPFKLLYHEMETQIENEILASAQKIDVSVDMEELRRLLLYDRGQYEKGYRDAKNTIVYCRECGERERCEMKDLMVRNSDIHDPYCAAGERRASD